MRDEDPFASAASNDGARTPERGPSRKSAATDVKPLLAKSALPAIVIEEGELHSNATEAEEALRMAGAPFYIRGDAGLMQPVVDEVPAARGRRTRVARLKQVSESAMLDYLCRSAEWLKFDGRTRKVVRRNPPKDVAKVLLSRDGEWTFPTLAGVITTPTLRPDGTIFATPGYDPQTQLLLVEGLALPPMPKAPSRVDAINAAIQLETLLQETAFVDEASKSVGLSCLITPVVRGAIEVAPMHVVSAPTAGSGKSYLIDLAAAVAIGDRAPVLTAAAKEEETEKRLGAALLAGQPIVSIDNVNGELGGAQLCQMVERPLVQVRVLGASKLVNIVSRATTFATGNNIKLVGDMTRRVIICSLNPRVERPELRQFNADPFDIIMSDRPRYVAAALTICRAYALAGFPGELPQLGSYGSWSRFVRSALVWLGYADPVATMEKARSEDPEGAQLKALLHEWYGVMGPLSVKAGEVVSRADKRDSHSGERAHLGLFEALGEVAVDPRRGEITGRKLGGYLRTVQDRIVGGLQLTKAGTDTHSSQVLWKVSPAQICG